MASKKKIKKLKNSFCHRSALKNKKFKLKRILFFTPSDRRENNNQVDDDEEK